MDGRPFRTVRDIVKKMSKKLGYPLALCPRGVVGFFSGPVV